MNPVRAYSIVLATFISLCLGASVGVRGQQPDSLPPNWRQMPPMEVFNYVMKYYDPVQDKLTGNIDEEALRDYALKFIAGTDYATSKFSYQFLNGIHWLTDPKLTEQQQERIRKGVLSRQDDWHHQPYAELRAKVMLMRRLKLPAQLRVREGRRWVVAGGKLSDIPVDQAQEAEHYFVEHEASHIAGSFSVVWEGQIKPPKSGDYSFSVSPINVNSDDNQYPLKVSMSVAVNRNVVLSANAQKWVRASRPVALQSDKAVPLRVDLIVEARQLPNHAIHALLYWEGPKIEKSLVPDQYLTTPDGKEQGLRATYNWQEEGQVKSLTRTDDSIDFAWTTTPIEIFADPSEMRAMTDLFWEQTMSSEFLGWCEHPGGRPYLHPCFQDPDATAMSLTTARRKEFLDQVRLVFPGLLTPLTAKQAVMFYGAFRVGNPDAALETFGLWATRHPDWEVALPRGPRFDGSSRGEFRTLAIDTTRELPDHVARLEKEFLTLPDGSCSLPVAYVLSYSHLMRKELGSWITFLDGRLNDASVSGDQRVNWLLARAFAEEIRQSTTELKLYTEVHARLMDGDRFLKEARRIAQSDAARVRVAKELAARLSFTQQHEAALAALQEVEGTTSEDQRKSVASWTAWMSARKIAQAREPAKQDAAAREQYIKILKERRKQSAAQKDEAAVARYEALIDAAGDLPRD